MIFIQKIKWSHSGRILLTGAFLLCIIQSHSQEKKLPNYYGEKSADPKVCPPTLNYGPDSEVDSMITMLVKRLPGVKNIYVVQSCTNISNCEAKFINNKRFILYNPGFLSGVRKLNFTVADISTQNPDDWKVLTILAHELGHHINDHTIRINDSTINIWPELKKMETEADETAGYIIRMLGGKLSEAQAAYQIPQVIETGSDYYPSRQERMDAVASGWNKANELIKGRGGNTILPDDPSRKKEDLYYYHFRRGEKYSGMGEREKAINEFTQAITIDDFNPDAYSSRGYEYYLRASHEEALQDYNKAIYLKPGKKSDYSMRASVKLQLKDYIGALSDLNTIISMDGADYYYIWFRADLKRDHLKDYTGALSDYNKVIELKNDFASAYSGRALLKRTSFKDYTAALADYDKAIQFNPRDYYTYLDRASLQQYDLKNLNAALSDLNTAISLNPNYAHGYFRRYWLKDYDLKDYAGALADINKAIELEPIFHIYYLERATLKHYVLNDYTGVLADYNKAIELYKDYKLAYFHRAGFKRDKLGDYEGALKDYNKAIELDPAYTAAYYNRAYVKRNHFNNLSGACDDYKRAAALGDEDAKKRVQELCN